APAAAFDRNRGTPNVSVHRSRRMAGFAPNAKIQESAPPKDCGSNGAAPGTIHSQHSAAPSRRIASCPCKGQSPRPPELKFVNAVPTLWAVYEGVKKLGTDP